MPDFKRIVLTTDLSPDADCATPYAVEFARSFGGSIDLLHAFEDLRYIEGAMPDVAAAVRLDWLQEARIDQEARLVQRAASINRTTGVGVHPVQLDGNSAEVVVYYARRENADCIVMATHGRSGFSHFMFGSVAERVLQRSSCPVLTVKPKQDKKKGVGQFKTIVMATDFSANSDAARPYALAMAKRYGSTLHVIHVFENEIMFAQTGAEHASRFEELMQTERAWREERLKNYARELGAEDRGVIHTLGRGQPASKIASYASAVDADCIVIATHGRTGLSHLLIGSVAERIVRLAVCPVLCVKPETVVAGKSESLPAKSAV